MNERKVCTPSIIKVIWFSYFLMRTFLSYIRRDVDQGLCHEKWNMNMRCQAGLPSKLCTLDLQWKIQMSWIHTSLVSLTLSFQSRGQSAESPQTWNLQLLRRIIVKLVMNLVRPRCLRAICCWVCSYLWAHRSWWAFTMPPHQEEGDRRGFTRQGRGSETGKSNNAVKVMKLRRGNILKNAVNRPLKFYGENWIVTSTGEGKKQQQGNSCSWMSKGTKCETS